jgi:Tfp pilus assembly protein PilX
MRMTPSRISIRARAEDGFTMIITLGVLLVASLLMTAAFVASESDIQLTHNDVNAKKAYYAAQAGISNYAFHLNADFNYWTYCTGSAAASNKSLNLEGSTANKVAVPGASEEKYAIQLLPASTAPVADKKCDPASPVATMIQNGGVNGGTFRIESTGYSGHEERTILATFAHTSFLNFLYYTKYETLDPVSYSPARPQCARFAYAEPARSTSECTSIQFVNADVLKGPVYTEDTASICSTPTFGRGVEDDIEFMGGSEAGGGGCTNSAKYLGTLVPEKEVAPVEPPPSNSALKAIATAKYTGATVITLEGEKMTVFNKGETKTNVAYPSNGVIYVSNGSCAESYTPYNSSYSGEGCGNVYVSGKYSAPLTIGAENDIIIKGNLTPPLESGEPTTNAVLGLIANNFVRIYHPVSQGGTVKNTVSECNANNLTAAEDTTKWGKWGSLENLEIYAAILAVNHSFIVDNFRCGKPLGKLTVYGAIAQIFRGTVGTHSGETVSSGYAKNYNYDERLHVESPPYFLNPVTASWSNRRAVFTKNP